MQSKTTFEIFTSPLGMAKINKTTNTGRKRRALIHSLLVKILTSIFTGNHYREFSKKFKSKLIIWSNYSTLWYMTKGLNNLLCTFIAPLFTLTRKWIQSQYPSNDVWIIKIWHMYTTKYYLTVKEDEIRKFAGKWMDLRKILLIEVTHTNGSF